MSLETISRSKVGGIIIRGLASVMESPLRYRLSAPRKILSGASTEKAESVLEIGCGTGYFTLPAADMIGRSGGSLIAIDVLSDSVALVTQRANAAGLKNVRVLQADATDTGLESGTFDLVLLFGVIPAPMIALDKLIAEIHRLLRTDGRLAVWPHVPGWLPGAILKSGLFTYSAKQDGVHNFVRC